MARARSIKPGFFSNDELVELPMATRLLFIGLWTIADKEGRLMDRPKKIKMEIFPADDVNCDEALNQLKARNFLQRYEVDGVRYIQITNWSKHQNPHIKEINSVIPECPEQAPELPVQAPEIPERAALIPSSLTPDSGLLTADNSSLRSEIGRKPRNVAIEPPEFGEIRKLYPRRSGGQRWDDAVKHYRKRLAEGHTHEVMVAGVKRYADWAEVSGKVGTEGIQQAATFLGDNKGFLEPWAMPRAPPAQLSTVERVMQANGVRRDERVVAEQNGSSFGDLDDFGSDVRGPSYPGFRRLGS
jgi:hypothetical protein